MYVCMCVCFASVCMMGIWVNVCVYVHECMCVYMRCVSVCMYEHMCVCECVHMY